MSRRPSDLFVLLVSAIVVLGGVSSASRAAADDSLTVEECVALARRQAPALVAALLDRQAAAFDSAAIAKNGRPDFSVTTGALVAPKGFYDPTITNLGDYELKLGIVWPVADGGFRARARERGRLGLATARSMAVLESRDAGLRAAGLAFGLLQLQEMESYQDRALDWLDRLGTLIRAGVASGVRSSADSVRVALERDAVAAVLEDTRLAARSSTLELLTLLGREVTSSVTILPGDEVHERRPAESDSIRLMISVERQPEVALARAADATARLDLLDARHRTAPHIDLSLDAGLAGADLTQDVPPDLQAVDPSATLADRLRRDLGASVAIHLRLPILDGATAPTGRAREAALSASGVRSKAETVDQRRRALALLDRWRSTFRRVEAARETSDRAETNLLKMKSLYSAGATALLDLLDARRVDDDARQRLAEARWEERMAQFEVEDRR
jgi:outer membrane protein TolC